ncbi:MAG: hypothetical protein GXP27_09565 [Planctomycetes bacterium]|nr:hypothetical protein [Planctomycetota bacterium]
MEPARLCRKLVALAAVALLSGVGCRLMEPSFDATSVRPPSELRRVLAEYLQQDRWHENARWSAWQEVKRYRPGRPYYRWVYGTEANRSEITIRSQSTDSGANPVDRRPSAEVSKSAESHFAAEPNGQNRQKSAVAGSRSEQAATEPASAVTPQPGSPRQPNRVEVKAAELATRQRNSDAPPAAAGSEAAPPDGERVGQSTEPQVWDGFWPLDPIRALAEGSTDGDSSGEFLKALRELAKQEGFVGWNATILLAQRDVASAPELLGTLERLVSGAISEVRKDQSGRSTSRDASSSPDSSGESASPSPSLRAAAAEAWCYLLVRHAALGRLAERQRALAPAGRLLLRKDLPNAVRAELFRGCSRYIPPDQIPRLANALERAPDGQRAPVRIRRAAMEACLLFALYKGRFPDPLGRDRTGAEMEDNGKSSGPDSGSRPGGMVHRAANPFAAYDEWDWPVSIWNGQDDPDARVRILFGQWLAAARPPDAHERLCRQLHDADLVVREAAHESLGRLGTATALVTLRRQAERPEARIRQLAAKGLAEWGPQELTRFLDDEAFSVRAAVARELARFPQARATVLLQRLVADRSAEVQKRAIDAVTDWPDDFAIPVLLRGLRDSTLANRQRCREQISRRLGTAIAIAVEAPREERVRQINRLVQQYGWTSGLLKALQAEELRSTPTITDQRKAEIKSWLATVCQHAWGSEPSEKAWQRLRQIAPEEVAIVERYASERHDAGSEILYTEVLPRLDPAYAALRDLSSPEVEVRRRAAQKLASLGQTRSLTPLMVRRLRELLAQEQDGLVWRFAMQAILPDDNNEAAQVALQAINHTWPDIRLLGCRYIARHGHPQHARWLLPLLHDANREVQLQAAKAAGLCRNPIVLDGVGDHSRESTAGSGGLRSLLNHQDARIRLAAAVSMSQLGDDQGIQELTRLSYHADPQVRVQVIREIGRTGRARFIEHLVRLAWTEKHPAVKRAILRSLEELTPAEELPPELATATTDDDRIYAWVAWWQGRLASKQPTIRNTEGSTHER